MSKKQSPLQKRMTQGGIGAAVTAALVLTPMAANAEPIAPDTTKPIVSVDTPVFIADVKTGKAIVGLNTAELKFSASDEAGLKRIVANVRDASGKLIKSTQTPLEGALSGVHVLPIADLPSGSTIRYNSEDQAGNISLTREIVVDFQKPTLTEKPGANYVNGHTGVTSFKLYDANKVAYVMVNDKKFDVTDAVWSDLNNLTTGNHTGGKQGENIVVLYDVAGNASDPVAVKLDTVGPVLTVKENTTYTKGKNGVYSLYSLGASDVSNVTQFAVNGKLKDVTDNVRSDLNFVKPGYGGFGGVEGFNTVEVFDGLGNISYVQFTLDTTKPVLALPDGGVINGSKTFSVSQTEANPDRTYVEFQKLVDGKWSKVAGQEFGGNDFNFTVDTTKYADGQFQLKVSTWDLAGNHTSATSPFTVDNSGPSITLRSSVDIEGGYEQVTYGFFDANKVDRLELNDVVKDLTNDQYSNLDGIAPGKFGAVEGENTLVVYDTLGNSSSVTFTLVVPVPEVVEPEPEPEVPPVTEEPEQPTQPVKHPIKDKIEKIITSIFSLIKVKIWLWF